MKNLFLLRFGCFLFLSFLFCLPSVWAQDSTEVVFDRPGITDSPYIVDLRNWQIELGGTYAKEGALEDIFIPSFMLRKSLHKRFELRLTMSHQPTSRFIDDHYGEPNRGYPVSLFGKWKIIDEKGWIPDIALMGGAVFPIYRDFGIKDLGYEAYILLQNNLSRSFSINYDVGILRDHPAIGLLYTYAICFNFTLNKRFAFFIENYAFAKNFKTEWEEGIDVGIVFFPTRFSQIDLSGGFHFLSNDTWHFVSLGYSQAIFTKPSKKNRTYAMR